MRRETIRCLKETAAKCRLNVVRMLRASGHGHIGGTYSSIDMVTALYFYKMNVNPEKPDWEDRTGSFYQQDIRVWYSTQS